MKAAFKGAWGGLKAFMGGGSTYLYITAGAALLGLYGYVNHLEHKIDDLKDDLKQCEATDASRTALVDSQERTKIRTDKTTKELNDVEDEISNSDDPLTYTFEWLRNKRAAEADNSNE